MVVRLRTAGCVFAEEEADLIASAASSPTAMEDWIRRRAAGEPLELILGVVEFNGLQLVVRPGVFVPRQRSMLLARHVARDCIERGIYLDLCTGTGAIAAAVHAERRDLRTLASDIDHRAVACARENLPGCWVGEGDLFAPIPVEMRGRIDAITVSAPYVPAVELARMPREARDYEPRHALVGGADGLDVHRRVVALLDRWLAPSGIAVLEVGEPQCDALADVCRRAGLGARVVTGAEGGYAVRAHR